MGRMYLAGILLLFSVFLVGCCLTHERDFEVNYSGELSGNFDGKGMFIPCDQFNATLPHVTISLQEISDRAGRNYVILELPIGLLPGKYNLSNDDFSDGNLGISVTIFDSARSDYFFFSQADIVSGFVELDAIPSAASQPVRGRFAGHLQFESRSLVVKGVFDFTSSGDFSYSCMENAVG